MIGWQVHGRLDGWMDGLMDGLISWWMARWLDGRMIDEWTDICIDGWIEKGRLVDGWTMWVG